VDSLRGMSKNFKNSKMEISNFILFFHLIFTLYFLFCLLNFSFIFFCFLLHRNKANRTIIFEIISNPGVFTICFAVVLAFFCSGICSTFVVVFPLLCPMFKVLFSDCVTVAVVLVLAVDPLTSYCCY
jgi:hypothetical protein